MEDVKPRRIEYVEQTRLALLDAAERLFVADGYRATSIDAVGAAARFTKGAVYRHFPDKESLFVAVFERVAAETAEQLGDTVVESADPWSAAMSTLAGFLDASTRPRYRRIVLEEGPTVLGQRRWRELDQHFIAPVLEHVLTTLIDTGEIDPQPVAPLARLCCATVGEAALILTQSAHPDETRSALLTTLTRMLSGLRAAQGSDPSR